MGIGAKTTEDIAGTGIPGSIDTTNASYMGANDSSIKTSKFGLGKEGLGPVQLPNINATLSSPLKGFIDISAVS